MYSMDVKFQLKERQKKNYMNECGMIGIWRAKGAFAYLCDFLSEGGLDNIIISRQFDAGVEWNVDLEQKPFQLDMNIWIWVVLVIAFLYFFNESPCCGRGCGRAKKFVDITGRPLIVSSQLLAMALNSFESNFNVATDKNEINCCSFHS